MNELHFQCQIIIAVIIVIAFYHSLCGSVKQCIGCYIHSNYIETVDKL